MNVEFHRRAEIALRSLDGAEKRQVDIVVSRMRSLPKQEMWRAFRPEKLSSGRGGDLYSISADARIRLVASISGEALLVQDIVPPERLIRVLDATAS